MVTRPPERATSASPSGNSTLSPATGPTYSPSTLYQLEIAVLRYHVAALEAELERKEEQRQAVVDRYERLLQQR